MSATKVIDTSALNYFWDEFKSQLTYYGTCSTQAATAAKTVTLTNGTGWELTAGIVVKVKFTNTNTATTAPTLNINDTGAKSIYYNGSLITATTDFLKQKVGKANCIITYVYDGNNYIWCGESQSVDREIFTFTVSTLDRINFITAVTPNQLTAAVQANKKVMLNIPALSFLEEITVFKYTGNVYIPHIIPIYYIGTGQIQFFTCLYDEDDLNAVFAIDKVQLVSTYYDRLNNVNILHLSNNTEIIFEDLVNQNAFSNIAIGNNTIQANSATDTLTFAAGTNINLSANTLTNTVTISTNADDNVIETVKVAGTALVPDANKAVDIEAATNIEIDAITNSSNLNGNNIATDEDIDLITGIPALNSVANFWNSIDFNNAGTHNSLYRGKYLGDSVTSEQWAVIATGTFDDLYIGDYWTINSINWRIAAFDYWLYTGDTECTTHHVNIVPDTCIVSDVPINASSTTAGAYAGCDFRTGAHSNTGMDQCISKINSAFDAAHILSHREYLANAVTGDYESSVGWYNSTVDLMNERMVYGSRYFNNVVHGTNIPFLYTIDSSQLPLFAFDHSRICNRENWWLRDVSTATTFVLCAVDGYARPRGTANTDAGVRPVFGICV